MSRLPRGSGSSERVDGGGGASGVVVYATDSMPGDRIATLLAQQGAALDPRVIEGSTPLRSRVRSGDVASVVLAVSGDDFDAEPTGGESTTAPESLPAPLDSAVAAVRDGRGGPPIVLFGRSLRADTVIPALDAGVADVHRVSRDEIDRIRDRDDPGDAGTAGPIAELAARVERAIDDRRQSRARSDERDRLETIVENFPGLIYRCRIEPDWPMEYVRGECREVTGYAASELESNEVSWGSEILHPNDRDRVYEAVYEELDTSGPFELTYRIRTRDGATRWVWERGRRITAAPNGDPRIEGFITDVTDRRERTEQLQVISHLLRHNVRNDMTVVRGYARLLAEEIDGYAEETATMVDRIDDLLATVDKTQPIVDVLTNPHDSGGVAVGDAIERAVETIESRYDVPPIDTSIEPATVSAIPELERAFTELLENAAVHTGAAEPSIAIRATRDAETVTVAVIDEGPVIPDMERDILSDDRAPEPLYHGTGLGLWLVEWIVRRSGGTLSFDETPAGGNVVAIELPRWD